MLERDLYLLQRRAQNQGLKQQVLAGALRVGFGVAKALGLQDIPVIGPEAVKPPENAQIERLLALGFHAELGMTEEQYHSSMPGLPVQPERFRNRFDLPVLVDPRVALPAQIRMHSVLTDLTEAQITQLSLSLRSENLNQEPYYMWTEEQCTISNLGSLPWFEQPINILEALALIRERPNIFRLIGSFSFDIGHLLSEDRIASITAAGATVPGPLGFQQLDENIKILTSNYFKQSEDPRIKTIFIAKGRTQKS